MRNLKVGAKLLVAFAVVILLFLVSVVFASLSMVQIGQEVTRFHDNAYMAKEYAANMRYEFKNVQKALYRAIGTDDISITQEAVNNANKSVAAIADTLPKLSEIFNNSQGTLDSALITNLVAARDQVNPLRDKAIEYAEQNTDAMNSQANALLEGDLGQRILVMDNALTEIASAADTASTNMLATLSSLQTSSVIILLVIAAVSLLLTIVLCVYITRSLTAPLNEIKNAANGLAEGNLKVQVSYQSKDELGQLSDAIRNTIVSLNSYISDLSRGLGDMAKGNLATQPKVEFKGDFVELEHNMVMMLGSFNEVLTSINQSADQVSSGSEQVSSGAQALSQGATEQASSVEELSATITEISAQVKSNAADAVDASQKVSRVGEEIMDSNRQMQELIEAISEISKSSEQIGQIISTIENISFQTNILALNAAVEAARAGAAGKGFAVVADEVRSLASKSAEAAKETTTLIRSSVESVERGTKLADEAAKSLVTVVESAKIVTETVDRIAGASNEQANSISQVSQGIDQISSVVQTNSATAEESAAASEELSSQSQVLKGLVKRFKLRDAGAAQSVSYTSEPEASYAGAVDYSSKY